MIDSASHKPARLRARLVAALVSIAALAVFAPAAHAVDLILLNGDPPQDISGVNTYGLVYVDNQLRLQGDTTINATSVYLGPNSSIGDCFVGTDGGGCTNGRHLAINASGSVTISNGFNLQPNSSGSPRIGGNLTITAGNITLGGDVTTTGQDGGTPGNITLTAGGTIDTQRLITQGGVVTAAGGAGVAVNGDIVVDAQSPDSPAGPAQAASSGHVNLSSTTGDVFALGAIFADALNGSTGIAGGNGGTVALTGRNVRTGFVDVGAGTGSDLAAGTPGSIVLNAQGFAYALGTYEATGSNSTSSLASGGGSVSITAGGPVSASEIKVFGGNGPIGSGGAGGAITISGGSVATGDLDAWGGNGTDNGGFQGNGGNGGTITIAAPGSVTLGSNTDAHGGSAPRPALAGLGGTINVSGSEVTTGRVATNGGGYPSGSGASPGVSGGPIKLSANANLTASGPITSAGSNASSGSADPAHAGGSGGPITLRAAAGALTLASQANSSGGNGGSNPTDGQPGGVGGMGGTVDVVSTALGPIASIDADGGNGGDSGDDQGPGGNGGLMRHWGDGFLFSDTFVASNRGGVGNPDGVDGARVTEGAPLNLTIDGAGNLAFQSASPDAEGFHVSRAVGDGPAEIIASTTATSGIVATSPVCVAALFSVVAYQNFLGWTSTSPAPVAFTTQPPGVQTCSDAPKPKIKKVFKKRFKKTPKKAVVLQKQLKRSKWRLPVNFTAKGIGRYDLAVVGPRKAAPAPPTKRSLEAKKKKKKKKAKKAKKKVTVFAIAEGDIPKSGLRKANVVLTKKARKPGIYKLRLRTFAPDGSKKKTLTVKLEVRK
ncbi:MAG: beta strand repeat-containing protein [Gaiellaceae bacterium]